MTSRQKAVSLGIVIVLCIASSLAYCRAADSDQNFRFAYGIASDNRLSVPVVGEQDGQLRNLGYVLAPGNGASALTIDPQARFVYVVNHHSSDAAAFKINAQTGWLTPVGAQRARGSWTGFGSGGEATNNIVDAFSVDQTTGALTALGSVSAGLKPHAIVTVGYWY